MLPLSQGAAIQAKQALVSERQKGSQALKDAKVARSESAKRLQQQEQKQKQILREQVVAERVRAKQAQVRERWLQLFNQLTVVLAKTSGQSKMSLGCCCKQHNSVLHHTFGSLRMFPS